MNKREMKLIQAAIFAVATIIFFCVKQFASINTGKMPDKSGPLYVERAVDGDTLKLSDGTRVRLIGVDTPELFYSEKQVKDAKRSNKDVGAIKDLGKKASDFTKGIANGKRVTLEYDVEKRDRYGRLLAYVYLEDGVLLNAKVLEEGYGQVMTIPPNVKHSKSFLKLQKEAREKGKGLWGEGGL